MVPQKPEGGRSRLKRVVMIGDHHQLPPVVKNMAFQKYAHLDQSLFTRFVRLGTPYLELNAQVRRPLDDLSSLCSSVCFLNGKPACLAVCRPSRATLLQNVASMSGGDARRYQPCQLLATGSAAVVQAQC